MNRIYELLKEEKDMIKYIPKENREEMFDSIYSCIKDQIAYYSDPYTMCMESIDSNNIEMISEISEYLWRKYSWFTIKPKYLKDELKDLESIDVKGDIWVYLDANDDLKFETNEVFFDFEIIPALVDMNIHNNCKHHLEKILDIIKKY